MHKVIYTSLFGDYDDLEDPEIINNDWDYICFSNHLKQSDFKVWKIKTLDKGNWSNVEASRFPKLCPHEVLKEYEYSIYIDSNILIKSDFLYKRAIELGSNEDNLISIPKHPTRSCLYKESEMLKYRGKDKGESIDKQIQFIKQAGFPEMFGLFENNIIWRKHLHPKIKTIGSEWWKLFMEYSKRDQLGLVYCLWKYEVNCIPLMPKSIADHRKSNHFEFSEHNSSFLLPVKRLLNKFKFVLKNGRRPKK